MAALSTGAVRDLVVDPFCFRQFDQASGKSPFIAMSIDDFERELNARYVQSGKALVDGYAPFCKHVFLDNFAGCSAAVLAITPENTHLLKSGYHARTEKELPVLTRWFESDDVKALLGGDLPVATKLDIRAENAAQGDSDTSDSPWGVVSVKAQDSAAELPMQPITMMRNSLGEAEGGSGVALDRAQYAASVAYWAAHAPIQ